MLFPFPLSQYGQEHYKHLHAQGISLFLTQNSFLLPLPLFLPGANREQLCTASSELCHPWAKDAQSALFTSPVHNPALLSEVQGCGESRASHAATSSTPPLHSTARHTMRHGPTCRKTFPSTSAAAGPRGKGKCYISPVCSLFPISFPIFLSVVFILIFKWKQVFTQLFKATRLNLQPTNLHLVCTVHHHLLSCHEPISKCFSCWWLLAMMYEAETKTESQRLQKAEDN